MNRYLPIAAAVALIIVTAWIQGKWTERWTTFPELEIYADQLKNVPMEIGDWKGTEMPETDKRMLEYAGAVGSLSRVYQNDRNESVSIFLVVGRAKDVFAHTPDRCYPAAGWDKTSDITRQNIETGTDVSEFLTQTYLRPDPAGNQNLRIYWSYKGNAKWLAPQKPSEYKTVFALQHALYKLYVVMPNSGSSISSEQNPAIDFIRVLIPELDRTFQPAIDATPGAPHSGDADKTAEAAPKSDA